MLKDMLSDVMMSTVAEAVHRNACTHMVYLSIAVIQLISC